MPIARTTLGKLDSNNNNNNNNKRKSLKSFQNTKILRLKLRECGE